MEQSGLSTFGAMLMEQSGLITLSALHMDQIGLSIIWRNVYGMKWI